MAKDKSRGEGSLTTEADTDTSMEADTAPKTLEDELQAMEGEGFVNIAAILRKASKYLGSV